MKNYKLILIGSFLLFSKTLMIISGQSDLLSVLSELIGDIVLFIGVIYIFKKSDMKVMEIIVPLCIITYIINFPLIHPSINMTRNTAYVFKLLKNALPFLGFILLYLKERKQLLILPIIGYLIFQIRTLSYWFVYLYSKGFGNISKHVRIVYEFLNTLDKLIFISYIILMIYSMLGILELENSSQHKSTYKGVFITMLVGIFGWTIYAITIASKLRLL